MESKRQFTGPHPRIEDGDASSGNFPLKKGGYFHQFTSHSGPDFLFMLFLERRQLPRRCKGRIKDAVGGER